MKNEEIGTFQASAGVRLAYRAWNVSAPRARLIITHGFGEHSGRYENLAKDLASKGISSYAWDLRGHGRSPGLRGHIASFAEYYLDLHEFRHFIAGMQPVVPLFMLGHSLGGLITLRYAQSYHPSGIRGVVLSSPLLGVAVKIPKIRELLLPVLKFLVPELALSNEINSTLLSHNPEVVEAYDTDPLVHDRVSSTFFSNLLKEMSIGIEQASEWSIPLAVMYAGADHIVSPEATERFCVAIDQGLITRKRYEDFYHEIFNEVKREYPIADLLSWIDKRLH